MHLKPCVHDRELEADVVLSDAFNGVSLGVNMEECGLGFALFIFIAAALVMALITVIATENDDMSEEDIQQILREWYEEIEEDEDGE